MVIFLKQTIYQVVKYDWLVVEQLWKDEFPQIVRDYTCWVYVV